MSFSCIKPVVVHSHSVVQLFVTPWTSACQAPCPSPTPELAQTQVRPVSDAIQLSHPLSSPSPPVFNPASGSFPVSWLFASGGQSIGASASVLPVNIQDWFLLELTGLILQSKGTLKSLLQHHSSKPLILQCSAFFMVHLSHPYMTTGKTIQTSVGKVMSLLFSICHSFSSQEHLLILWLQSPSAVILEPKKIKSVTDSIRTSWS